MMLEDHGIIAWIVIGGIAGAIAKLLMPGRDPGGCIITVLLGVAGAFVAGWLGQQLGLFAEGSKASWGAAIIGAFLLLFVYRLIARRS